MKLGTHQLSTAYFPMVMGLGLAVHAITAMVSVAVSMNTANNLDQYFYVAWDGKSYRYIQQPEVAEKNIDNVESRTNILFKGYLDGATTTYGIYKLTPDKLWVFSYKRQ